MAKAKKHNPPKTVAKAVLKVNRDMDIEDHGKPTAFRHTMTKNPKAYSRKEKHKEVANSLRIDSDDVRKMVSETLKRVLGDDTIY